ncbi:MAG TPA: hypothetical protein VFO77_02175 [Actinoplanes sp.]|nr:hypothetical protein [Actinoplanes sp.]
MTRIERLKLKRRMQRRIRMVVEERRIAQHLPPDAPQEGVLEPDPAMDLDVAPEAVA